MIVRMGGDLVLSLIQTLHQFAFSVCNRNVEGRFNAASKLIRDLGEGFD
jgi:hypothetical protein